MGTAKKTAKKLTRKVFRLKRALDGSHIATVAEEAIGVAKAKKITVSFEFNGVEVVVDRSSTVDWVVQRWQAAMEAKAEAYRASPEYRKEQAERAERERRAREAVTVETAQTEEAMRDAKVPEIVTPEQLGSYIASLVEREHDYGTCVYAMSLAATAAFNYVARRLGVTGFQASFADLDVLRRTRRMEGPWMIVKGEDALYPQYDLPGRLAKSMEEWRPWLRDEARRLMKEREQQKTPMSLNVWNHWKALAAWKPKP